jgi:hypothetical protein
VKEIIQYECEICHTRHSEKQWAEDCEAQGTPQIPIAGTIYQTAFCGRDLFFAVSNTASVRGHCLDFGAWAARDNGAGDNLPGQSFCQGALPNEWLEPDQAHPAYARLAQALRKVGIEPIPHRKQP